MGLFGATDLVLEANIGTMQVPSWVVTSPTTGYANNRAVAAAGASSLGDPFGGQPGVASVQGLYATMSEWHVPGEPRRLTVAPQFDGFLFNWPVEERYLLVPYLYTSGVNADVTGVPKGPDGVHAAPFDLGNFLQLRWRWNNAGTFASAPRILANVHVPEVYGSIEGDLLAGDPRPQPGVIGQQSGPFGSGSNITNTDGVGGFSTDSGGTQRSLLKINGYGSSSSTIPVPTNGPTAYPQINDGTDGGVINNSGWLGAWQDLFYDFDYLEYGAVPSGNQAWYFMVAIFVSTGKIGAQAKPSSQQGGGLFFEYAFT